MVHQVVPALAQVLRPLHPVDPLAPDLQPDPHDQPEMVGDPVPGAGPGPGHDEALQPVLRGAGQPAPGAAVADQPTVGTDLEREVLLRVIIRFTLHLVRGWRHPTPAVLTHNSSEQNRIMSNSRLEFSYFA